MTPGGRATARISLVLSCLAATATAMATTASPPAVAAEPVAAMAAGEGPRVEPTAFTDVAGLLERVTQAAGERAYDARMLILGMDVDGPTITEVEVRHDAGGHLQVGRAESWLVDVTGSVVAFDDGVGAPLLLGDVRALPFSIGEAERNYDVTIEGRARLDDGTALVVTFARDGVPRDRIYVDDATDLVVRRETFDAGGRIARVVAMTDLVLLDAAAHAAPSEAEEAVAPGPLSGRVQSGPAAIAVSNNGGWVVPTTLADGFEFRAGYVLSDPPAVHLVYSDGLYTVSLLQQEGRLDAAALEGAVPADAGGRPVYRWPGSEPERMVFDGGGHAWTVVSDAPAGIVVAAIRDLPYDTHRTLPQRVAHGFARMASWLWPFG